MSVAKIVSAMLLWASCFPLITAGLQFSPHLTFATLRAVLAGLVLTLLALILRRPFPKSLRLWLSLSVVGFGATTLGFLGMFHAAEFVSPGLATVIANTQPLLVAIIAILWLRERLSFAGKLGLLLGFLGILIIALPSLFAGGNDSYAVGVGYIILAALGVTFSNLVIKRIAGDTDALASMGLQMLIGSIPLAIWAFSYEDPTLVVWSPVFIASLLGLALFGSALVYWLWFSVLETVQLTQANAFSFLVPVFGLAIGAAFFEESLSGIQYIGIALILFGIYLVNCGRNIRTN